MNSPPQLRGEVFSSPNNVSNFKSAPRPGEPRRLNFGPDSPQRVHKPVPSKKKSAGRRRRNRRKKRTRRRRRRRRGGLGQIAQSTVQARRRNVRRGARSQKSKRKQIHARNRAHHVRAQWRQQIAPAAAALAANLSPGIATNGQVEDANRMRAQLAAAMAGMGPMGALAAQFQQVNVGAAPHQQLQQLAADSAAAAPPGGIARAFAPPAPPKKKRWERDRRPMKGRKKEGGSRSRKKRTRRSRRRRKRRRTRRRRGRGIGASKAKRVTIRATRRPKGSKWKVKRKPPSSVGPPVGSSQNDNILKNSKKRVDMMKTFMEIHGGRPLGNFIREKIDKEGYKAAMDWIVWYETKQKSSD